MDLGLQCGHLLRKRVRHPAQRVAVHLDAVLLHLRQHRHQRTFQRLVDRGHLFLVQLGLELLPQTQGDVGVLGRIGRGVVDRHPIKGDRGFAAAQQRFDRDRLVIEVAFRQRVHAMPVHAAMQRVGQQHGVVDRGHVNAVAGKDLGVVFHVLADLEDGVILQHRFQHLQRRLQRHLPLGQIVRAKQIVGISRLMRERHIAGLPGHHAEADADQIGDHLVETGGLGIHRDIAVFANEVDPLLQGLGVAHGGIFGTVKARRFGQFQRGGRGGGCFGDGRGLAAQLVGHTLGQGAELHLGEEAQERFGVRVAHFQIVEGEVQLHVAIQLHKAFGHLDLLALLDQGLAALGLFDLLGAVQQILQRAELVDQQRGGLDADAGRAGHVVDRVARKRLHIHHPVGPDAEFLSHAVAVDAFVLHRVEHLDPVANQLHQVLV